MVDKLVRIRRALLDTGAPRPRPTMLAVAGDSASGKTTLARGLVEALGEQRCVSLCVGDYHRYDREERRGLPFTPLHPDCNYVEIIEQHLRLLASGQPILKPVYDHSTGTLARPELVEPRDIVIVEGVLPLYTRLLRACFDVSVYLDPPEPIRRRWKVARDVHRRGYREEEVLAELERREPESAAFVRPQRRWADIVVRFAPIDSRQDPPGAPLSATLLLRPTVRHPDLGAVLGPDGTPVLHRTLNRDQGGTPVDALHIHGHAPREESLVVEKLIWQSLSHGDGVPESLGLLDDGARSEPLALTQLVVLLSLLGS
ncbi:MAG: phosphoribulokinase, partial [Actinomycetota bacterium]|nr:phosphoribulokinase [Actinomycetota bacterium]